MSVFDAASRDRQWEREDADLGQMGKLCCVGGGGGKTLEAAHTLHVARHIHGREKID